MTLCTQTKWSFGDSGLRLLQAFHSAFGYGFKLPSFITSATETGTSFSQRGKLTKIRPSLATATPVTCWSNVATWVKAGVAADAGRIMAAAAAAISPRRERFRSAVMGNLLSSIVGAGHGTREPAPDSEAARSEFPDAGGEHGGLIGGRTGYLPPAAAVG